MAPSETSAVEAGPARSPLRLALTSFSRFPAIWVAAVDIALVVFFGFTSTNHAFFNGSNFTNMALDSSQVVLLATGSAVLLSAAELDISLGANVILSSCVGGKVMTSVGGFDPNTYTYSNLSWGIALGVLAALATGLGFGLVNGLIVTRLGVNSFITTLGTLGVGSGLSLVVTGGSNVDGIPQQLQSDFGVRDVSGIPLPAIVCGVLVVLAWLLITYTRFGMRTVSIGSSREAAERAGLKIDRHLLKLFAGVGLLAGVCGVIDISRFATTNLSGHQTDALSAIAGAVIGGTSLFGGKISIPGAVCGALLAVILQTGLVILGLAPFYQQIAIGGVLILAVFLRGRAIERTAKGGLRRRRAT
jgi:ribose transport system permease protein